MLDDIQKHIFDLLAADERFVTGGFTGVKRAYNGDTPVNGYINLFDWPFEDDSREARPSVYVGYRGTQPNDRSNFESISNQGLVRDRIATIPLLVVVTDSSRAEAVNKRKRIAKNIRAILSDPDNIVQDAFWYLLTEGTSIDNFRYTGGGSMGANEARVMLTFEAHYSYLGGELL